MTDLLAFADAVDIGHGRGRLAPAAARSLARVDAAMRDAFGRVLDVNEAWRSPEQADENYRAYLAYLNYQNGGAFAPWAPIALPADKSVHCKGFALDSDDGYNTRVVRILNDHGWFHTVYRWVNGVWTLVEQWHFEYQWWRDNHRHETAGGGSTAFPTPDPAEPEEEDEDMAKNSGFKYKRARDGKVVRLLANTTTGWWMEYLEETAAPAGDNGVAAALETGSYAEVTETWANAFKASLPRSQGAVVSGTLTIAGDAEA